MIHWGVETLKWFLTMPVTPVHLWWTPPSRGWHVTYIVIKSSNIQ